MNSIPAAMAGEASEGQAESVFVPAGEGRYEPTEHARGPWDPRALHGGAPAALMVAALERVQPGEELPFARLAFEFLRPIPLAPLELSTRITRPGRRVQALEADLRCGERAGVPRPRAAHPRRCPASCPSWRGGWSRSARPRRCPAHRRATRCASRWTTSSVGASRRPPWRCAS